MRQRRCFVVTPIGSNGSVERRHADMVFGAVLMPTLEARGYSLERSDLSQNPGQITADIFDALLNADLCIADLSYLNPNVFYELAVRHAFRKPVIQIALEGTHLPFDAANQRTIFFDISDFNSHEKLRASIVGQCEKLEENAGEISNPLTHALGVFELSRQGDAPSNMLTDLIQRVQTLEASLNDDASRVADGIFGQGDLATKNVREMQALWRSDQKAANMTWTPGDDGSMSAQYCGFSTTIRPQSRGRWSSAATEIEGGFSVPYPTWRSSADDAKAAIVRAIDEALSARDD